MSSLKNFRMVACTIIAVLCFNYLTVAQYCDNSSTAINGKIFPPLIDATVEDLVAGLETGLFTSVDLVNVYTQRIAEVNDTLLAVTQLNPDAISIARELDAERANGTLRSPIHGLPILIKENIGTHDSLHTTAGSYALLGAKLPRDSVIASRLRSHGAIILGKSNLSQWANWRSMNTSNGWSAFGGQVTAPYYPGQDPSGSSSGSGVSSALGLAAFCLGTETSGSITSPSELNNIVGIKPTVGLTSRDLVVPISSHQDTIGPMARSVKDTAYLLSVIAGTAAFDTDNYTSAQPFSTTPDYVAACNFSALSGARIGIPRNLIDVPKTSPSYYSIQVFNSILPLLRAAGATIIDNTNFTGYPLINARGILTQSVLATDFETDLPASYLRHLTTNPHNITSVPSLRSYTHSDPREAWPERDTLIWAQGIQLNYTSTSPLFWSNYTTNLHLAGPLGVTGALKNHSLDALILPTNFAYEVPALIGSPLITVPLGATPSNTTVTKNGFGNLNATGPNFPFGISFMGAKWSEEKLIGLAYAFEQRTKVRGMVVPYIQPRTELVDVVGKSNGMMGRGVERRWEGLWRG